MLWPPSWTSQVIASPELTETFLGVNESFFTTTVCGVAIAGEATARVTVLASASGTNFFMGMTASSEWDRTRRCAFPAGALPRARPSVQVDLVLGAQTVPEVELDALGGELHRALAGERGQHGLQGLLLGDAGVERLLAAEAGGDLQRLAPVIAEAAERVDQEVAVGDRLADLQRGVPGGEHRQVVVVEVGDRLGVLVLELAVRDLVDPRTDELTHQLTTGFAPDRLGDDADGVLWFDKTERHLGSRTIVVDRRQGGR